MTWRPTTWARWLGWTLVFSLVAALSWVAWREFGPAYVNAAVLIFLVPTIVAAFVISMGFRVSSWAAGPAVALACRRRHRIVRAEPPTTDYRCAVPTAGRAATL